MDLPKVLLPLVNTPMIDYSLAWLKSSGVEQVFVVVCNGPHSKQIIDYLAKFERLSLDPKFTVTTIAPRGSVSAGDALRFVYERDVIHGDFVLISGDTVTNMSLKQVLQDHKDRKKKDCNAIMTMGVIKKLKHLTGNNDDQLVMAIHPNTKELLYYDEDGADSNTDMVSTLGNKGLLLDNPAAVQVRNDIEDCYIDVCSPEVLSLFADNFDYQHLRRHFVTGLLEDDIMGYRIYTQEIDHSSYAARVVNFRSYDTISKDIIQRSTYPLVPDIQFSGKRSIKLESQGTIYKGSDIQISSSADVGPFTLVGSGTSIGDYSKISNSVIGNGCRIGSNVSIEGSYVWDNVTIQDGCQLNNALVCDGVVIQSGVVLEPEFPVIPAYSKVSSHPQPTNQQDSDEEEREYAADRDSGILDSTLDFPNGELISTSSDVTTEVGVSGVGYYIWSDTPKPEAEMLPGDGEASDGSDSEAEEDFDREVEASFLRLVHEGVDQKNTIIEVTSLRLAFNLDSSDCARALFWSMMKLAIETPYGTQGELLRNAVSDLLQNYVKSTETDEQIEIIMTFEEMCSEFAKDFAPLFDKILHILYEKDLLTEDAILLWASEREGADASDKLFVNQSQSLIEWLKEAEEEDQIP
ncbi:hypothetical protein MKX01_013967 [Papaver californicum]|nr:hypothetical protein MKX01_013967 [Papaver californicum]